MSTVTPIQYPFDRTGIAESNRVVSVRDILTNKARAFVPDGGPFYADSVVITNLDTGETLRPIDDYLLVQPHMNAALRTARDVQSVVYIKIPAPVRIQVTRQVVGGEFSYNLQALYDLLDQVNLDEREVKWGSILGRPWAYPAAPHLHDIGDTYGWEYVVWQLEKIARAILIGDDASHEELRLQIKAVNDSIQAYFDAIGERLRLHEEDRSNPHEVTKTQVGLGLVDNYATATDAEALAGVLKNRFMTPHAAALLANKISQSLIGDHVSDKTNPHNVTKAQIGLGSVENLPIASKAEAEAGALNTRYMTPLRSKEAIMALIGNDYLAHKANTSNPHSVTKAQVGLGSVENFPIASSAEALAGALNTRYMTPVLTKNLAVQEATAITNAHANNKANPHSVTAAQVGAYSTTQTDTLLATKLGKTEKAVDSDKLDGRTRIQVLNEAYAMVGTMGKRDLYVSTNEPTPSVGNVGDVWFKY